MQKYLLWLAGLVIILAAAYAGWMYIPSFNPPPNNQGNNNGGNPPVTDYQQNGILVRNNPGMKEGVWFLIWEAPGAPGNQTELAFGPGSTCQVGGSKVDCGAMDVPNGTKAAVSGTKKSGSLVTVVSLNAESVSSTIRVTTPLPGQEVSSPMTISGEATGSWYFEAVFGSRLEVNGQTITSSYVTAKGDWMTADFVPFEGQLTFSVATTTPAELVLSADNPSGLPQYEKEIRIPVVLLPGAAGKSVSLYFYDSNKDKDASGNILCSRQGLVEVKRTIPNTVTPLKDSINLLLAGPTAQEKSRGITSEFPLQGVKLTNAEIKNGTATLTFEDPNFKTSGGSCRAGVLWFQIEKTALQFPSVKEVKFMPEELFQP